jgi:hypothetical protein
VSKEREPLYICEYCDKKTDTGYFDKKTGQVLCRKCFNERQREFKDQKIADLEAKLAEKDAELNRYAELFGMKDKDFYVVEKTEYEKMKQGAKEIVDNLKQQLAEYEDFMEEQDVPNLQILKDTLYQANLELYKMRNLQRENQALKSRWQKLKDYLITTIKEKDNSLKYYKFREVLDKMQELEDEE